MTSNRVTSLFTAAAVAVGLGLPGIVLAYDEDDAIRDCNDRMRSEYKLTDFLSESAKQLPGEGHRYEVSGKTKIDGTKHDYRCDIENRHVNAIHYDGPEPEGMDTAEKVAIGAAAAVATAIAVNAMSKDKDEAAEAAPTAAEPKVRTNADGSMEVSVSADCTVQFNDIGMREGKSEACTSEELTAASKAVTKHLSAARANQ